METTSAGFAFLSFGLTLWLAATAHGVQPVNIEASLGGSARQHPRPARPYDVSGARRRGIYEARRGHSVHDADSAEPGGPIVLYNSQAALRMAVAERETIPLLGDDWDIPGIYVLLYPVAADATFDLYIGKASTGGLRSRLLTHKVAKENWTRVLLVARDTTHGFNSAQVGWLDGRLWSVAKAAAGVKIVNGNQPKDETLPAFERASLEFAIAPIRQVMRLLGYALDPEDETVPVKAGIGRRYHGVTLQDLLAAQLLKAGDSLEFTYAGHEGVSAVVDSKGQLVLDGAPYGSPSAAGFAARGGIVNGWQHWAVRDAKDNLVSLGELRAKLPPKSVG